MKKSGFLVIGMATAALLLGLVGCGDKPGGGTGDKRLRRSGVPRADAAERR